MVIVVSLLSTSIFTYATNEEETQINSNEIIALNEQENSNTSIDENEIELEDITDLNDEIDFIGEEPVLDYSLIKKEDEDE